MTYDDHRRLIDNYGPRASAYVDSPLHAEGVDLDQIDALLATLRPDRVLDLGCGGGHAAYRAARHAREVVACDVTPAMVEAVELEARRRGLNTLRGEVAAAEALPFSDARFDAVLCRFTAHHWQDLRRGLTEAGRVTRTDGVLVFIDTVAPLDAAADTHLQTVEYLRDPSHVRDYTEAELKRTIEAAGFHVVDRTVRELDLDFDTWTGRTRTSPDRIAMLRRVQSDAAPSVQRRFAIKADGSFVVTAVTFVARALEV